MSEEQREFWTYPVSGSAMEMIMITAIIAAIVTTGEIIIGIRSGIMVMIMPAMPGAKLPLLQRANQTSPRKARCWSEAKSASSWATEAR